jgi:hypothetical protein
MQSKRTISRFTFDMLVMFAMIAHATVAMARAPSRARQGARPGALNSCPRGCAAFLSFSSRCPAAHRPFPPLEGGFTRGGKGYATLRSPATELRDWQWPLQSKKHQRLISPISPSRIPGHDSRNRASSL